MTDSRLFRFKIENFKSLTLACLEFIWPIQPTLVDRASDIFQIETRLCQIFPDRFGGCHLRVWNIISSTNEPTSGALALQFGKYSTAAPYHGKHVLYLINLIGQSNLSQLFSAYRQSIFDIFERREKTEGNKILS